MKLALYARIVFGASGVLFGIIALMWHDTDTWQSLSSLWKLPAGTIVGGILMLAQIVGGVALVFPRSARPASMLLIVVYALFALACVPGIVRAPRVFGEYDGFFEQFSLLCGVVAVYSATAVNGAPLTALSRAARFGYGLSVVSFTLAQIVYPSLTSVLVPTWIPPNQTFWTILTTVAFALAAVAVLINVRARLALRLLTLMLALFGVLVWVPHLIAHPEAHSNWSEFALNFLITGAAWMVAESATS
jgi:uncharacterized membrane protein YphA (DoxX/SURF4 family)